MSDGGLGEHLLCAVKLFDSRRDPAR